MRKKDAAMMEGKAKGKAEGRAEGELEAKITIAKNMKSLDLSDELIAKSTNLPLNQIKVL
jgi:predicted transposase/invertase (TIGR01784 family)